MDVMNINSLISFLEVTSVLCKSTVTLKLRGRQANSAKKEGKESKGMSRRKLNCRKVCHSSPRAGRYGSKVVNVPSNVFTSQLCSSLHQASLRLH